MGLAVRTGATIRPEVEGSRPLVLTLGDELSETAETIRALARRMTPPMRANHLGVPGLGLDILIAE